MFKKQDMGKIVKEKSRIGETKHLLTDADSSTNAIGGWTKNTPKPASYITASYLNITTSGRYITASYLNITASCHYITASYLNITASCRYITASLKQARKISKKNFVLRGDFRQFSNKSVHIWDHLFPLLFPKDSGSLKILDIRLREVGAKRPLNGTSKVNRQTDRRTHIQTDISTYRKHRPRGPMLWKQDNTH